MYQRPRHSSGRSTWRRSTSRPRGVGGAQKRRSEELKGYLGLGCDSIFFPPGVLASMFLFSRQKQPNPGFEAASPTAWGSGPSASPSSWPGRLLRPKNLRPWLGFGGFLGVPWARNTHRRLKSPDLLERPWGVFGGSFGPEGEVSRK